jgi:putative phage-type endonuclease
MSDQGSYDWLKQRAGKVTASRVSDVVARTKSGFGASRKNYMAQLLTERLTGEPTPSFSNAAMVHGTDTEPMARDAYQAITMETVQEEGFIVHPTIEQSGASPDGLIGEDGLIEIKCPNTATHLDTLESGKVPAKYITQMQWQMACTGRQWCDFMSFDPRLPERMQAFIKRVPRDEAVIGELEAAVTEFLTELAERVAGLEEKYGASQ